MIASRYRATAAAVALLTLGVCAAQATPAPLTSDQPSLRLRGFDALAQRDYGCGVGPAGPIPPGGYWHYGRFYPCPRLSGRRNEMTDGPRMTRPVLLRHASRI